MTIYEGYTYNKKPKTHREYLADLITKLELVHAGIFDPILRAKLCAAIGFLKLGERLIVEIGKTVNL